MTMTIQDAFDLPSSGEPLAGRFVVKLRDLGTSGADLQGLLDDYVVTPTVRTELPKILAEMKQIHERREDYGRFIHGSFGSGKSHFLSVLGALLEDAEPAWKKLGPLLGATDHRPWIQKAKLLVVRAHMLSVKGKDAGLDRAIYEAFNDALTKRGKRAFEFLHVEGIFREAKHDAELYGELFFKQLEKAGVVGSREEFLEIARGKPAERESFAREYLKFKGRDPASAGIDPDFQGGLVRMAEHAKAQGYDGVVLLVDEFLLWLAEKSGQQFVKEINNLTAIVDHPGGPRPLPLFVFVARQRNLQEFFPDLVDDTKIHEHVEHHAQRFQRTNLEDVELRHIVKERVLRPRHPDAVKAAVAQIEEKHQKVLAAVLGDADASYLRDVYPFHPMLIDMLVDVTSLMQRERSALRLIYELLVVHYPKLPLGELLPVGSAFEAIFPESGVEASKKIELLQELHEQYWRRLRPSMKAMRTESVGGFDDARHRALDQLVKTVLLAEVSPRLRGASGLTIERLVQLNSADVEEGSLRSQVLIAEADLQRLSQRVPELQLHGTQKTAVVRYVLGRVNLSEVLQRARAKVDNLNQRFLVFWTELKQALGLPETGGFREGGPNADSWDVTWHRTRRRGEVKLGNVRAFSYDDFRPAGEFKLLIDYPWDEPGFDVSADLAKAQGVKKSFGAQHSAVWLPRHFTQHELETLTELAAVRFVLSEDGAAELFDGYSVTDRKKLQEQAELRAKSTQTQLHTLLLEAYVHSGEFYSLIGDVEKRPPKENLAENLEHLALSLLHRRYPAHPPFAIEPKKAELELLAAWMVDAASTGTTVPFDEAMEKALRGIAQPLEIVTLGQSKAGLRTDTRYLKELLTRVDADSVSWVSVAEELRTKYGLQPLLLDLFLCFVCRTSHRALDAGSGEPIEVKIGMPASLQLRLERGELLTAAEWHRARELGPALFGLEKPAATRSLQAQDGLVERLRGEGKSRRAQLQELHERLVKLGVAAGARLIELGEANARLAPLGESGTNSCAVLRRLLERWPDDAADAVRAIVHRCKEPSEALDALDGSLREQLLGVRQHALHGAAVQTHLGSLEARLAASQLSQPLLTSWVKEWNFEARGLVKAVLQGAVAQPPIAPPAAAAPPVAPSPVAPSPVLPPAPVAPPPVVGAMSPRLLVQSIVQPGDPASVERFVDELRRALSAERSANVRLVVTKEEST